MTHTFASGVKLNDGVPSAPSISFITDKTTGMYLNTSNYGNKSLGFSCDSQTVATMDGRCIELLQPLTIADGASSGAVLTSDANGEASWKVSSASGVLRWNSLYKDLDIAVDNNTASIVFDTKLETMPSITVSKESDYITDNFDIYIKGKSTTGFTLYSNAFMSKTIVGGTTTASVDIGEFSTVRLVEGGIGVCYYDITEDRMYYTHSADSTCSAFSVPIVIEDISAVGMCSIALVNGAPAIVYIADNDQNDEWHYISAKDIVGTAWNAPVTIYTSTKDVTFLPVSLFLNVAGGVPVVFTNNEFGTAQTIIAKDTTGLIWNTPVGISNLVNHQILSVAFVHGNPIVVAKSNKYNNVYYVRASLPNGKTWPIGATQIVKSDGSVLSTNIGKSSNTFGFIDGILSIITSDVSTNDLYIAQAHDALGAVWGPYTLLSDANTSTPFPRIFLNNNISYLLYNNYSGNPSKKNLIEFDGSGAAKETTSFINTLSFAGDHQVLKNIKDNNSILIMSSNGRLSILKFYGNDLNINWIALS